MGLKPEDIRGTMFATTRMRAGYDMDEVDAFLDVVEADLAARARDVQESLEAQEAMRAQNALLHAQVLELEQEVATLRSRLAAAEGGAGQDAAHVVDDAVTEVMAVVEAPAESDVRHTEPIAVPSPEQTHEAAAVLTLAERSADEIIRSARVQAREIRAQVRGMLAAQLSLVPEEKDVTSGT